MKEIIEKITKKIEEDICDRRGIGDEYEQIDDKTRGLIRKDWTKIIMEELMNSNLFEK